MHLVLSLGFALLEEVLFAWITPVFGLPWFPRNFAATFRAVVPIDFHLNVIIYWLIVGAQHSVGYYLRFLERERTSAQLELRASAAELALLRKAASITAEGFWAGAHAIAPGKTQRQVECEVMRACLNAGSDGASIWPWVRSGPFTMPSTLFEAFADYRNMDRTMRAGEIVRLDLGCDFRMYKGDFGHTLPVSGRFDAGQKETLELLNGAYLAGVQAMRPAVTAAQVQQAFRGYVEAHEKDLHTPLAREAASGALKTPMQPLHGLGVDMAEGTPKVFREGNVICYEPGLIAGGRRTLSKIRSCSRVTATKS